MAFRALSTAPKTAPSGETERTKTGEEIRWHKVVSWRELGIIPHSDPEVAMGWAKQKWGGSPVLVDIGTVH